MTLGSDSVVEFEIVHIGGFSVSSFTLNNPPILMFWCHTQSRHTTCRNIINQHNKIHDGISHGNGENPLKFEAIHDPMKEVSLRGRMLMQLTLQINYAEDISNEFSMRTFGFRFEREV